MKRLLYFFPYFLTNLGALVFFITWGFLAKDSYFEPFLRSTFSISSWLLLALFIFSVPRFLIKGIVPDPFKKGIKEGFWFISKTTLAWIVCIFLLTMHKRVDRLLDFYQVTIWISFFLAIYCHYRWGKSAKKIKEQS